MALASCQGTVNGQGATSNQNAISDQDTINNPSAINDSDTIPSAINDPSVNDQGAIIGVENSSQESPVDKQSLSHQHDSSVDVDNVDVTSTDVSHLRANIEKSRDGKRPKIAIIIDDLGYQRAQSTALLAIGEPLSYAVIPNTPHAKVIATDVVGAGQELMLHIPMQTISARKWEQGLTEDMSADMFGEYMYNMLDDYPFAKGVNNHGGSLLTQNSEKMQWLMRSLKSRGLFFVDSRTTPTSVARETAEELDVLSASRDVFLDNDKDGQAIAKSFERVKRLAKRNGHAIAIGHPYPQTITFLAENLPDVSSQGFELVFMSELLDDSTALNDTE